MTQRVTLARDVPMVGRRGDTFELHDIDPELGRPVLIKIEGAIIGLAADECEQYGGGFGASAVVVTDDDAPPDGPWLVNLTHLRGYWHHYTLPPAKVWLQEPSAE